MKQYIELGQRILNKGRLKQNRTGVDTVGIFGAQMRFNLQDGFPLLTSKKTIFKAMIAELLWFLEGSTDNNRLHELGAKFWDKWACEDGALGPIYSKQWRDFNGVDQISELIHNLKTNPFSRRHVVTAWNPSELPDEKVSPQENVKNGKMCLAACHCLFQFYVEELSFEERAVQLFKTLTPEAVDYINRSQNDDEIEEMLTVNNIPKHRLSCQLYQRSCDFPVGCPVNIASYSLLTMMIAQCVNMVPGDFVHTFGDLHVYVSQLEDFKIQLKRQPFDLPTVTINPEIKNIFDFKLSDFTLNNYKCHEPIKYKVEI